MFFCIHAPASAAAAVNRSGINPLSAYSWSTFFINSKPAFINGQRSLVRTLPDDIILERPVFENFMLVVDLIAKLICKSLTKTCDLSKLEAILSRIAL